jgi:uracil-DNA glycosylase family 4
VSFFYEPAKKKKKKKAAEPQKPIDPCEKCGLHEGINSPMMKMHGKGKSGIFVAAQSPGRDEDKKGRQLIGDSGDIARNTAAAVGFDFDRDFHVQNAFRCHPSKKKQSWLAEVKLCHTRFMEDVRKVKPWLVVAMGKEAIQASLGLLEPLTVAQYQSLLIPVVDENYWVYCTNHPAALIHGGKGSKYEWIFRDDWAEIEAINRDRPMPAKEVKELWDMDNWEVITDFGYAMKELGQLYHRDFFRDYENYPLKPYDNDSEVVSFAVAYKLRRGMRVFCIPWKDKYWDGRQKRMLLSLYKKACENPNTVKMAHHHKHELQWDQFLGIHTQGRLECTQLRQHLIREVRKTKSQAFQVFARWGCRYGEGMRPFMTDMRKAPEPDIYEYNCHDVRFGLMLWDEQEKEKYRGFGQPYEVLLKGDRTLTRMEVTGVPVDQGVAKKIGEGFEGSNVELTKWLLEHEWAKRWEEEKGEVLNLTSPQQIGILLFDILELPGGVRTETQWSTSKDNLAPLAGQHEWISKWQEAGRMGRFKGTFVDGHIFSNLYDDGRLHGTFYLSTAETYRSSMRDPNLQNVTKRDARGRTLRKSFIPLHPGWEIAAFDYDQHELITNCHNTEDKVMIKAVLEGHDFHYDYAGKLLNKVRVNQNERDNAGKNGFVFPIVYGAYPKTIFDGLQRNGFNVPFNHVKKVWKEFRREFYMTVDWQNSLLDFFEQNGYVESKLGFRRRAPLTANECINFPTQSLAFHYLLYGLHIADETMLERGLRARPVLQIHDEAIFHYPPKEERVEVFAIVKESFEELPWEWTKKPPVKIGGKIGSNWYDMKEVKL